MSGILVKNRCLIRNMRKSFLLFSTYYSSLRVTYPRLQLVPRHERCLSNLALKHSENGTYKETSQNISSQNSSNATVDTALLDLDLAARRTGRIGKHLVEQAFSLIVKSGKTPEKVNSLYLLRSCGMMRRELPEDRVSLADEIWNKLEKLGYQYDVSHYNSILKIYVDCNHKFTPSDFLVKLESNNIEPNKVTFLYLMEKYCNDGNLNGASEILEYMKEKGYPINETVFNTLIMGHMKINDVSGAKEIFDIMRASNLTPSAQSYVTLASGFATNGDIEGVKSTVQEAEKNGVEIFHEDYLQILSFIQSDEHLPFVDEVLNLIGNDIINLKQSVLNTVFDLLNNGACDSAYKILLRISIDEESARLNTNVFLNHLVKTNQPLEKVFKFLNDIDEKGLNHFAWLNCTKACIDVHKFDETFEIFKIMVKKGIPVRNHHIYSIFPKLKSEKEILSALKHMQELGVLADFTLYVKHVLPCIDVSDPEKALQKLEEAGQCRSVAYNPLFEYYTQNGQSSNAWYLAKTYPVYVAQEFSLRKFFSSHPESVMRDVNSPFHEVLSFVIKGIGKNNFRQSNEIQGKVLAEVISLSPSAFQFWLKRAKEEGFQPSTRTMAVCYNILSEKDPKLLIHFRKLEGVYEQSSKATRTLTIEEEDKEIEQLEERGLKTDFYLQQLLLHHLKNKNADRINHLKSELDRRNVKLSPLNLYHMFYFYKQQLAIEEADKYLKALTENYPDFVIDTAQILEYATMLLKFTKFDDAMDTLKTHCQVIRINGSKDFLYRATRKFFDAAIESGNMDFLRNAQSHLLTVFNEPNHSKLMHEPLIKVHVFRNNLEGAVEEFKSIVKNKNIAPYSTQLLKKCITSDDHHMLETVIDTASSLEGKIPVLQELSIAFMELGRKAQAAKVLENLGNRLQPSFVINSCVRFYSDRNIPKLEEFLSILKNLEHVNKAKAFSFLFKLYDDENEVLKALDLYNEIKRTNMFVIDGATKELLFNLLTRNNVAVPPELNEAGKPKEENIEEDVGKPSDPIMEEFHELLVKGDTALALKRLDHMKKGHIRSLPFYDMTKLVSLAIENNLVQNLSGNVQAMSYLIENANEILHPLLTQYSESGDLELLHRIASFMPDFSLKAIGFNGFICKSYIVCGKHAELLTEMENRMDKKNKLFSTIAFFELLNYPDLKDRAINLAEKYYESNFSVPIAIVWAYHLINANYDATDELEKKFNIEGEKVDSILLRHLRKSENIDIGEKLIKNLNERNTRLRFKERAYGTLLDVLVLKEMYEEAVKLVLEAKEKRVELERHFCSTLITLKSALERENKPVPFTIPSEESIMST